MSIERRTVSRQPPAPAGSGRSTAAGVGLVVAACAVCCAAPIAAVIGGVAALGAAAAFVVWPAAGVVVAALVAVWFTLVRRRLRGRCLPAPEAASVVLDQTSPRERFAAEVGDRR